MDFPDIRNLETNSGRCIIVDIFRFVFSRDWHEALQYGSCQVEALNLGFFAEKRHLIAYSPQKNMKDLLLYSPVQSIKCKNAEFWINRTVRTDQKKEVD